MKNSILAVLISLLAACGVTGQTTDQKKIKTVIQQFSAAGDTYDTSTLDRLLDDSYRIVMNRLFGSKEVTVMPKETYIKKISTKEFGGDKRIVTFQEIVLNGNTAMAKVAMKGEKATFESLLSLIKDDTGNWTIVSDIPVIK